MQRRSSAGHHAEWLSLIDITGPFLSIPVLTRTFPQGLEADDRDLDRELRIALEEFAADEHLEARWVRWVIAQGLGYPGEVLAEAAAIPAELTHRVPEHNVTLRPELAVMDGAKARLLVDVQPPSQGLDGRVAGEPWTASPRERMAELLRATGVRLGLVTNGRQWTLVNAKSGESTGFATWDADLWLEERLTLRAFRTLLGVERTLGAPDGDALWDLLDRSADAQHEVTDQLGQQVRFAIELLIASLDRADRDRDGKLLAELPNEELYLAAITVMMRLVFLFTAEERGLLPLSDPLYASSYAASTLRAQLQEEADRYSEDPLERRSSAWYRLLAAFRAVHSGIDHDRLRLPAYGGGLFDPDRFPFLEGRATDGERSAAGAEPLPVDDRTVLHILDALQMLRSATGQRGGVAAQRLSYRSLDVEQIGHVYEGLLDHTAVRTSDPALGFDGKLEPEIALAEVEQQRERGDEELCAWLAKETGRSTSAIAKRLGAEPDPDTRARLRAACGADEELLERLLPYQALLRLDLRGYPLVFLPGSLYVTQTLERRASGTYYTPRSLAEEVVEHALDPLAYDPGPAEEADRERWKLKSPAALLDLKVCDMAMGSGAFLVAACRYLSARLVEAWETADDGELTVEGTPATGAAGEQLVPADPEERLVLARRLVADRCLYGVDKNPMAVEMAKLSLWLITMARERPFSFLDHAMRTGDSLLGITDLRQIEYFHINPERGAKLHGTFFDYTAACGAAVEDALHKRRELEQFTVVDIRDAERKERLHLEASEALDTARLLGDLVIGAALATAEKGGGRAVDRALTSVEQDVASLLDPQRSSDDRAIVRTRLADQAHAWLNAGRPPMAAERRCFHWPLELPEVFLGERKRFDAVVGNPPFQGGTMIASSTGGDYRRFIAQVIARRPTDRADLVVFFMLRATDLARSLGLLATNSLPQGDSREVGLGPLIDKGWILSRADKSVPWPGNASVSISKVWLLRGPWEGTAVLDGVAIPRVINAELESQGRVDGPARRLGIRRAVYSGSKLDAKGFVLAPGDARRLLDEDPDAAEVVLPLLNGQDLQTHPEQCASRWAINFGVRSRVEAQNFQACWSELEERVRPEVLDKPAVYKSWRRRWWQYWNPRVAMYDALAPLDRAVVLAGTSSVVQPAFVSSRQVFTHALIVFAYDDNAHFGLLSSGFHWWWTVTRASTLETRIRYTPTDCFETFAQPALTDTVEEAGRRLDEYRQPLMLERGEGLTKTYNRVHDRDEAAEDIAELRRLHVELDYAVRDAYGWDDLDLGHDFHETRQGIRYTFEPVVRTEILDRLLELNHERYAEEVRAGLHDKGKQGGRSDDVRKQGQEALL